MLAAPAGPRRGLPGDGSAWAYEVKWDGMRVLADITDGRVRLSTRTGGDVTAAFPELSGPAAQHRDVLLDGEVVVLRDGVPSFAALAERIHVRDLRRGQALAAALPATFIVFDVLRLYGVDLTGRSWQERREALERLAPMGPAWQLSPVYDDRDALVAATLEQGLEGVVAKRRSSRYLPGARSGDWVKLAHRRFQTCLVGGWRTETHARGRIGALLIGVWDTGAEGVRGLRYAGRVGSGLTGVSAAELQRLLGPLERDSPPFAGPVPRLDAAGSIWVEPQVVVEVRHKGHTEGGRLREPVLRGLRPDADPATVADE
ncbi:MAG TPA: non-homologous end-joining DNA ligase [Kineosporiaceae bacterium]|nr:non-homologous end-joining DNA ligase [Kineosporiaceae bacterium]